MAPAADFESPVFFGVDDVESPLLDSDPEPDDESDDESDDLSDDEDFWSEESPLSAPSFGFEPSARVRLRSEDRLSVL